MSFSDRAASPSSTPNGVSAIVVNWNGATDIELCLRSLLEQTAPPAEIVVVDNGSTDDSVPRVRAHFPDVTIVEAGSNLGFAEGCNRGLTRTSRPWVALLNNDASAAPDWLETLSTAAKNAPPKVGMLQSRIVYSNDTARTNSTGVLFRPDATFIDRDFDGPADLRADEEVFCVSAGAALYRRSMLDALRLRSGPFDREFFMYFEDVDLGWRARLAGWQARYVDGPLVRHGFHGSALRHGASFVQLQCRRNRVRMLAKNGSTSLALRTLPRTLVDLAASVARGGVGELAAFARAWRSGRAQRREVDALIEVPRREVESRWAGNGS